MICHRDRGPNGFDTPSAFIKFAEQRILNGPLSGLDFPENLLGNPGTSAVLFLLGDLSSGRGFDPCLILNKRSQRVRQPGDLCCPGGHVSPYLDPLLSRITALPGMPLWSWPQWRPLRQSRPVTARRLALLLTTSLRESLEEMRLNPTGIRFIGPLPPVRLVMFRREIFPMVGWVRSQRRFFPNREVEKIVRIPIRDLVRPDRYRRYRLQIQFNGRSSSTTSHINDYPGFLHRRKGKSELLWGATYRITMAFLEQVFDFTAPDPETLPIARGVLNNRYINGR